MNKIIKIQLFFIFFIFSGCTTFHITPPKKFVVYDKKLEPFKAVTAEGVRFRVKKIKNEPKGDCDLWSETIILHLRSSGYHIVKKQDIQNNQGLKGKYILSLYRYAKQNFSYVTAIYVTEENIFLIEAAGPFDYFEKHKKNILKSIISFKQS